MCAGGAAIGGAPSLAASLPPTTMAAKTVMEKGTSVMEPLKGVLLTYFMPESCYDSFFLDFNFLDGELAIVTSWLVKNEL